MKITNIETYAVWGGFRNFLFVVVDTDEGISGVGEAGITGRELAVIGAIEHFKPLLIGQDPFRTEHLWQLLFRGGFFPAQRIIASAISAIDIALWDIKGKALGVPIYELLGGRVRDKVICYPHNAGHGMDVSELVESCLQTKQEGWKFVRWGLGDPLADGNTFEPRRAVREGIREFEALRTALGDDIELCFDLHTRVDQPDAIRVVDQDTARLDALMHHVQLVHSADRLGDGNRDGKEALQRNYSMVLRRELICQGTTKWLEYNGDIAVAVRLECVHTDDALAGL